MSSSEAFVRVQRLLADRDVIMVLCGFLTNSPIASSLSSVGLLEAQGVEVFATLSDAMECELFCPNFMLSLDLFIGTENAYLRAWFLSQKAEGDRSVQYVGKILSINWKSTGLRVESAPRGSYKPAFLLSESFAGSPRRTQIQAAADRTIAKGR